MYHCHIEPPLRSLICFLPSQDICQLSPFYPILSITVQSSSLDNNVSPRYQNEETAVISITYNKKNLPIYSSVSTTTNFHSFLSLPCRDLAYFACV